MPIQSSRALIGVIHLPALPGSPRHQLPVAQIVERSVDEARILHAAGFDAAIVENLGDMPFTADRLPPASLACMAVVADRIRNSIDLPLGINALRNDALAALGIAAACGASFIRVNVLTGAVAADQGIIEGRADEVLRYRKLLGTPTAILADVFVKHAVTLHAASVAQAARDTLFRGLADGVILTGSSTGAPADLDEVRRVRAAVGDRPVFVGSGVTVETVAAALDVANGVIVGTALKPGGDLAQPIDLELVERFARAAKS